MTMPKSKLKTKIQNLKTNLKDKDRKDKILNKNDMKVFNDFVSVQEVIVSFFLNS